MESISVQPFSWATLLNMGEEALEGFDESRDRDMFVAIRDCLMRHDAYDKFGLFLVHRHFDIADDEEMVEHVDFAQAKVEVYPVKRDNLDMTSMIPTNWFFVKRPDGSSSIHVAQIGFAQDLTNTVANPFDETYMSCLSEICEILDESDSLHRFGMFLIRNQFDFEMDENQLECTDHERRTLTLTTQLRSNDAENALPTNWLFTPTNEVAVNCCVCARNSGGHLGTHMGRPS